MSQVYSPTGGGFVEVSTQVINNNPNIDFLIPFTYTNYMLVFTNVTGGSSNPFRFVMQFSVNLGGSFLNTGYQSGIFYQSYDSLIISNFLSTTESVIALPDDNSVQGYSGNVFLYNFPGVITKYCDMNGCAFNAGKNSLFYGTTSHGVNTPINLIRFLAIPGNLLSGRITLYGLKE